MFALLTMGRERGREMRIKTKLYDAVLYGQYQNIIWQVYLRQHVADSLFNGCFVRRVVATCIYGFYLYFYL